MSMETLNAETLYAMLATKDTDKLSELPLILEEAPSRALAGIAHDLHEVIAQRGNQEHEPLLWGMIDELYRKALEKERQQRVDVPFLRNPMSTLTALAAMMGGMGSGGIGRGHYQGENRVYKPVITKLQKGQSNFSVNGHPIPAGSYKAAVKKYQKMVKQGLLPASPEPEPNVTTQAH